MSDYTGYKVYWIDNPKAGWGTGEWDFAHTLGCAFAAIFWLIGSVVYIIAKRDARSSYLKQLAKAEEAQKTFFQHTGANVLGSAIHLGSHPLVPFNSTAIIGVKGRDFVIYSVTGELLHSISLEAIDTEAHVMQGSARTVGTTITPKNGGFGTVSSNTVYDFSPDSVRSSFEMQGKPVVAIFRQLASSPLSLIQNFNQALMR